MAVYLLGIEPVFPPCSEAEPDGLLAIGGDFSPERLLFAYSQGIFPWFEADEDIYWFSPDPRMVLFTEKLKVSPSLARTLKQGRFEIRFDHDFRGVMEQCAKVQRQDEPGTWISDRFIEGYSQLHSMGFAHSAESYIDGRLVGGLYGVALGKAFFGESMFYLEPDASKVAFVSLVERLKQNGVLFIDCQVDTPHLRRFGAEMISRVDYLLMLQTAIPIEL
jgi:leucyl/phenylalanyl-tRNA--protein transferase